MKKLYVHTFGCKTDRITISVLFVILVEVALFLSFDVNPLSKPLVLLYLSFFAMLIFWDKYRNEYQNRPVIWSNLNSMFILNSACVMFSLYLRVPAILLIISPLLHVVLTSVILRYVKFSDAWLQRQEAFFITLLSFAVLLPCSVFDTFPMMPHLMFFLMSILSILLYCLYYSANRKKQKFEYSLRQMFGQLLESFIFTILFGVTVLMSGFMINMVSLDETSYSARFVDNFQDSIPYYYAAFILSFYLLFVFTRVTEMLIKAEKLLKSLSKIEWVRIPVRIIETILVLLFIILILVAVIAYINKS